MSVGHMQLLTLQFTERGRVKQPTLQRSIDPLFQEDLDLGHGGLQARHVGDRMARMDFNGQ